MLAQSFSAGNFIAISTINCFSVILQAYALTIPSLAFIYAAAVIRLRHI